MTVPPTAPGKIMENKLANQIDKLICHPKNHSKGAKIRTGIEDTIGDYIIIQNANLEYNLHDYLKLLKPTCITKVCIPIIRYMEDQVRVPTSKNIFLIAEKRR